MLTGTMSMCRIHEDIKFSSLYVVLIVLVYLHNHVISNRFAIVAVRVSFYSITSNHPVVGSITVKDSSMICSS